MQKSSSDILKIRTVMYTVAGLRILPNFKYTEWKSMEDCQNFANLQSLFTGMRNGLGNMKNYVGGNFWKFYLHKTSNL